jgi:hypothetical protein
MPRALAALAGLSIAALAVPAPASAATLKTNAKCYLPGEPVTITGTGWTPGSAFGVTGGGISATGFADTVGSWTAQAEAPGIASQGIKPKTFQLAATQDAAPAGTTSFQVVNFVVTPKQINGDPTETTTWIFGGFLPGKKIYFHVKRADRVYTQKAGKGDSPCGTLKARLPRVPAVPASALRDGKYKVFVDNRKKFKVGGRQYTATITVT